MAKQIKQIRWFGLDDPRNFPSTIDRIDLEDAEYFEQFSPILQLSIHTLPGTKIYCNNQEENPIYIGHSGVYQLDLTDTSAILYGIHFNDDDLSDIENANVGLIIDLVYNNVAEDDSEMETETVITSTGGKASVSVDTHIKNIHKNIWYGVTDKISPYIMERDSKLEKAKTEFSAILQRLKDRYQQMLANLDPNNPNYTEQFANCSACYEKCLKELIAYYEQVINSLSNNIELDPNTLMAILTRIENAFNGLKVEMVNEQAMLRPELNGNNINFDDLREALGGNE